MKTIFYILLALIPSWISAGNPTEIADGNNKFAFSLYRHIATPTGQNIFYSPFSISTAMAMVYAGAREETATQISLTMNFQPGDKFHTAYMKLLNTLDESTEGSIKLNVANSLWAQKDYHFLDSYFDIVKSYYKSELKNVDFIDPGSRETARKEINSWVAEKTNDKITDILGPSDLNGLTRLVLVNAIYFYGDWASPFKKESTMPKKFFLANGSEKEVPFMNQRRTYPYYENDRLQAIEIPYKDNKASMLVFLPKAKDGLTGMENSFDYRDYQEIISGLQSGEVSLSLPKFRTKERIGLSEVLSRMGMPVAFSAGKADFSGMTGNRALFISDVIHEAYINVDEKGTEAAAATTVVMGMMSVPQQKPVTVFNADHPFIFCIRDNTTGAILFMGRVMSPGVPE